MTEQLNSNNRGINNHFFLMFRSIELTILDLEICVVVV